MSAEIPFRGVLVANRGEIAVRIGRTLRRLGIGYVAVWSEGDEDARHVREADRAVRVPSYLDAGAVVRAAQELGAGAVHPGYGFLAENAAFARAVEAAGLVFVGPPPEAIAAMGDKISAKQLVEPAGVPVVPGVHRPGLTDDDLVAAAAEIGFPVLLKPSAGGGGKGMHRVDAASGLPEAVAAARREALGAFGDAELLVERYVERPRHVEIQVLADAHGGVIHLGERECSLQRRHQKVVEESPAPGLPAGTREAMGAAAVAAARACGYRGAGTVEFVLAPDGAFYFLEMNTRLQVEHPVTELVTGVDLVEEQLRVAAGLPLRLAQEDVVLRGHAVEARLYAEDPARGFLPTGGEVLRLREPAGEHVRVDSGIGEGSRIGSRYDPMLAKVIAWGEDRPTALRRLDRALERSVLLGLTTNAGFLRTLLADEDVRAGRLDTGLIGRLLEDGVPPSPEATDAPVAAALAWLTAGRGQARDPFDTLTGWRIGGPAWVRRLLRPDAGEVVEVALRGRFGAAGWSGEVRVGAGEPRPARAVPAGDRLELTLDGVAAAWDVLIRPGTAWAGRAGGAWRFREAAPEPRGRTGAAAGPGPLTAPMPGTVTAVHVKVGDPVAEGQPVAVVEAMKMEHVVRATTAGTVTDLLAEVGRTVALDEVLAVVEPEEGA